MGAWYNDFYQRGDRLAAQVRRPGAPPDGFVLRPLTLAATTGHFAPVARLTPSQKPDIFKLTTALLQMQFAGPKHRFTKE